MLGLNDLKKQGALMSTTRIFGYMRFSYLGRSDVRLARQNDDLEYRKSVLYAPDRLEERFYFFEKICLPSLKWQSDQDFRFAIFTSPDLPEPYQQRLKQVTEAVPQIDAPVRTKAACGTAVARMPASFSMGMIASTIVSPQLSFWVAVIATSIPSG